MTNARFQGPMCQLLHSLAIDPGTLCLQASRAPSALGSPSNNPVAQRVQPPVVVSAAAISGLLYPLTVKATADYHTGARQFGSARSGGRKHAGIDLYAPAGTFVRALAAGKVISVYPFYAQTFAIEIDHGSFIARYGEVDPKDANIFVAAGDDVERGEKIAVVGKLVGITVPSNMLHLELYGTPRTSALTVRGNKPYQRRLDLINPTASIDQAAFE